MLPYLHVMQNSNSFPLNFFQILVLDVKWGSSALLHSLRRPSNQTLDRLHHHKRDINRSLLGPSWNCLTARFKQHHLGWGGSPWIGSRSADSWLDNCPDPLSQILGWALGPQASHCTPLPVRNGGYASTSSLCWLQVKAISQFLRSKLTTPAQNAIANTTHTQRDAKSWAIKLSSASHFFFYSPANNADLFPTHCQLIQPQFLFLCPLDAVTVVLWDKQKLVKCVCFSKSVI